MPIADAMGFARPFFDAACPVVYIAHIAYYAHFLGDWRWAMNSRIRIILLLDHAMPEELRRELGEILTGAAWTAASDDNTTFVCRARPDDLAKVKRQVRKTIEFAAFTAGQTGRISFILKAGDEEPVALSVSVGLPGTMTRPVKARAGGLDFATERVPGGSTSLPANLQSGTMTQLKTAF